MDAPNEDPRVRRTRDALVQAGLRLASERQIERISVSDLTAAAGVNRATFYKHYPSVRAVVLEPLIADLDELRASDAARRGTSEDPSSAIRKSTLEIVEHLRRFEAVYRRSLVEGDDGGMHAALITHFEGSIHAILNRRDLPGIDPALGTSFVAHAMVGALIAWLRTDATDERLVDTLVGSLPGWWSETF